MQGLAETGTTLADGTDTATELFFGRIAFAAEGPTFPPSCPTTATLPILPVPPWLANTQTCMQATHQASLRTAGRHLSSALIRVSIPGHGR